MPVCLNRDLANHSRWSANLGYVDAGLEFRENSAQCVDIGLLNNMPDGALQSTERQFLTLLDAAADGILVRLSLYALPDVPRSDTGQCHIRNIYSGAESLAGCHIDGLIVTGAEPRTSDLRDEPYWAGMTEVLDWAEHNTHSTVLSCLAAHAAVLHLDGVVRRRLDDKLFGLFESSPVSKHNLTAGLPSSIRMPHSRWNDLREEDLSDYGYQVLMRSEEAGVDTFIKRRKNLMVFFQGHPEYEANTLLLEYRRDVGRYLRGERDTYPAMPNCYFDPDTAQALSVAQDRALSDRRGQLLAELPITLAENNLATVWRSGAVQMYRNWLTYLCAQKERRLRQRPVRKAFVEDVGLRRRAVAG